MLQLTVASCADEFRFNPRPGDALPPDLVTAGNTDSSIQQAAPRRSAFVRGGELHTTENEPSVPQPPAEPAHQYGNGQDSQPPLPEVRLCACFIGPWERSSQISPFALSSTSSTSAIVTSFMISGSTLGIGSRSLKD